MSNALFLHIATIGDYQQIVDEIISYIDFSKFNTITANIAGEGEVKLPEGIKTMPFRSNLLDFEFSTIDILRDFSKKNPNSNICYIHTKGASTKKNICIDDWRQYMLYFNLNDIKVIEGFLNDYDTCGVDLVGTPVLHYSGNFWWATSSHINSLVDPRDLPIILSERHKGEFWICSSTTGKYKTLHNSNIDVYARHLHRYTTDNYIKNENVN
jgi:hypothetical protein